MKSRVTIEVIDNIIIIHYTSVNRKRSARGNKPKDGKLK